VGLRPVGGGTGRSAAASGGRKAASRAATAARWGLFTLPHPLLLLFS
jgi:hypothetical protein